MQVQEREGQGVGERGCVEKDGRDGELGELRFFLMDPSDGIGEMDWVRKGWGCVRREEWCVALGV